jgi:hypothetical protein
MWGRPSLCALDKVLVLTRLLVQLGAKCRQLLLAAAAGSPGHCCIFPDFFAPVKGGISIRGDAMGVLVI